MKKVNTSIRLKQVMSESHLRQVDILERTLPLCAKYDVKMNKSDISQYVSGKVEPNQDKLFVLSLALNVSEGWLMGYDVPKSRSSSMSAFPEQDRMLLENFHRLSDSQQARLLAYLDGLLDARDAAKGEANSLAEDAEREVDRIVAKELAAAKESKVSMK